MDWGKNLSSLAWRYKIMGWIYERHKVVSVLSYKIFPHNTYQAKQSAALGALFSSAGLGGTAPGILEEGEINLWIKCLRKHDESS